MHQIPSVETKDLLGLILQNASSLAGIKEPIQDLMKDDLKALIYGRFGFLSLNEIWKAFQLERQLAYGSKSEHYQFFSTQYVAEILEKYTHWKATKRREYHIEPPKTRSELPPMDTQRLNDEAFWDGLQFQMEHYRQHGKTWGVTSWLWKGLVKRGLNPEIPDYKKSELEAELVRRLTPYKSNKNIRKALKNMQFDRPEVITLKQEIALEYFLKQLIENQIDINSLRLKI